MLFGLLEENGGELELEELELEEDGQLLDELELLLDELLEELELLLEFGGGTGGGGGGGHTEVLLLVDANESGYAINRCFPHNCYTAINATVSGLHVLRNILGNIS